MCVKAHHLKSTLKNTKSPSTYLEYKSILNTKSIYSQSSCTPFSLIFTGDDSGEFEKRHDADAFANHPALHEGEEAGDTLRNIDRLFQHVRRQIQ